MLHIDTLLLVQVGMALLATLFIGVLWRLNRDIPGPGWWTAGFALASVGLLLLALRGMIPDWASIVLANLCVILDLVLDWNGMRLFTGRPGFTRGQWRALLLPLGLYTLGMHLYSAIHDDIGLRIGLTSVLFIGLSLASAVTLLRSSPRSNQLAGWIFLLYALGFAVRLLMAIFWPESNPWNGQAFALFVMSSNIMLTAIALSLTLMISERLTNRAHRQKELLARTLRFREEMEVLVHQDIKGSLLPILALVEDLSPRIERDQEASQLLRRIKQAGLRIKDMIGAKLNLDMLEHGEYALRHEIVDMVEIVRQASRDVLLFTEGRDIDLNIGVRGKTDPEESAPLGGTEVVTVSGDASLLYSMASNLLRNAVEASPDKAAVSVSILAGPDVAILEIGNEGEVPIPIRARYGQKYASAGKAQGRGLGAYAARLAIEAHGGSLFLDSSVVGRTTIVVRLPRQPRTAA